MKGLAASSKRRRNKGFQRTARACGWDIPTLVWGQSSYLYRKIEVVNSPLEHRGGRGGPAKLSLEDQGLMAWAYWRAYRRQVPISARWQWHETTRGGMIKQMEDLLLERGKCRLSSQQQLDQPGWAWQVLVVEGGELSATAGSSLAYA